MQRRMIGTLCVALIGMAALIGEAPRPVYAQELPPSQRAQKSAPLAGTKWVLVESDGQRIEQDGRQPYFVLKALERYKDGSEGQLVDATDSCGNGFTGAYRTTGNWLHVRMITRTLLACRVSDGMPRGLEATLTGDQRFRIDGAELDLLDNSGKVRARFIAASGE